jgi:hypothetical protein
VSKIKKKEENQETKAFYFSKLALGWILEKKID